MGFLRQHYIIGFEIVYFALHYKVDNKQFPFTRERTLCISRIRDGVHLMPHYGVFCLTLTICNLCPESIMHSNFRLRAIFRTLFELRQVRNQLLAKPRTKNTGPITATWKSQIIWKNICKVG